MAYTTINKSTDYFNTTLYSGSASTQSVNIGYNLTTDGGMVWLKPRNATDNHRLLDTVRGKDSTLTPNASSAAGDNNNFNAFTSTGFELLSGDPGWNNSGTNYVSWNWLAGSGNDTGTSNSDGTITSTVSANTTSGFSIVKYTGNGASGATVGHGLGSAPKMVIVKELDNASTDWYIYHAGIGATKFIRLNLTNTTNTTAAAWNDTAPSSSVFTLGNGTDLNGSSENYIAYCFAEKTGFSKFGSYTGNGNANGTFIYTGFKPAFVMVKNTSNVQSWYILDNKRNTYNPVDQYMSADTTAADQTATFWDYLSNGIKIRGTISGFNTSSDNYIYMAFAEAPLVGSNNIPATAR